MPQYVLGQRLLDHCKLQVQVYQLLVLFLRVMVREVYLRFKQQVVESAVEQMAACLE
jgi:hypothetical protein